MRCYTVRQLRTDLATLTLTQPLTSLLYVRFLPLDSLDLANPKINKYKPILNLFQALSNNYTKMVDPIVQGNCVILILTYNTTSIDCNNIITGDQITEFHIYALLYTQFFVIYICTGTLQRLLMRTMDDVLRSLHL